MAVVSMSEREFARLDVLLNLEAGRIRAADAGTLLGLKRRQVFRLLQGFRERGAGSLRMALRRTSARMTMAQFAGIDVSLESSSVCRAARAVTRRGAGGVPRQLDVSCNEEALSLMSDGVPMISSASIVNGFPGSIPPGIAAGGRSKGFEAALAAQSGIGGTMAANAGTQDKAAEDAQALVYARILGPQGAPDGTPIYANGCEYYDTEAAWRLAGKPEPEPSLPASNGPYDVVPLDDLPADMQTDENRDGLPDALDFDNDGEADAVVYQNRETGQFVLVLEGADTTDARVQAAQTIMGEDTDYMQRAVMLASRLDREGAGLEAIVGHSYGGACAAVAGTALDVKTYTFGAPPIGDGALERDTNGDGVHDPALGEYDVDRDRAGEVVEAYELGGDVIPDLSELSYPGGWEGMILRGAPLPPWAEDFIDAEPLGEEHLVENPDFGADISAAAGEALGTISSIFKDILLDPDGARDRVVESVADVFEVAGEAHSMEAMIQGLEDEQDQEPAATLSAAGIDKLFRERLVA